MDMMGLFGLINFFFAVVIGLYFLNLLRSQQSNRSAVERESRKEMEKLRRMKQISLTEPLAEKTRPATLDDIVGQEEGLKALRAALCGPNPQHVHHLRAAGHRQNGGRPRRAGRGEAQSAVALQARRGVRGSGRDDGPF